MPELPVGDELTRLRAADPLDASSLPSPADPQAQALLATILDSTPSAAPHSRRTLLVAAAAAVVIAVFAGVLLLNRSPAPDDNIATNQPTETSSGGVPPGGLSPGGTMVGSCVELYDLQTLTNREMAFDGTVQAVTGDSVTFTVTEWYRGGDAAEITLKGASTLNGLTSVGPGAPLEPGTRLLVAGDGGFAWSCGFTQPYDPAVANEWKAALGD